jgi:hypothetical protein
MRAGMQTQPAGFEKDKIQSAESLEFSSVIFERRFMGRVYHVALDV